jgi:3'-phosphoadenosine 5'-phosphosulfate sulfotransferase (PAPS reductase)/FAD synthetase
MHFLFSSMGNDSLALIQWAHEAKLKDVHVIYCNTQWASSDWPARVEKAKLKLDEYGFSFAELETEGLMNLVLRKRGWPRHGMHFCTQELKIWPSARYMDEKDPERDAICLVGIRREESFNRRAFPEWTEHSDKHGNRSLWAPLANFKAAERDVLIRKMGFEPLPHRSSECHPCVNANKAQLRLLDEDRIKLIEKIETALGPKRSLYRPEAHGGAVGIREVIKWAHSERGQYEPPAPCDSGYCGE